MLIVRRRRKLKPPTSDVGLASMAKIGPRSHRYRPRDCVPSSQSAGTHLKEPVTHYVRIDPAGGVLEAVKPEVVRYVDFLDDAVNILCDFIGVELQNPVAKVGCRLQRDLSLICLTGLGMSIWECKAARREHNFVFGIILAEKSNTFSHLWSHILPGPGPVAFIVGRDDARNLVVIGADAWNEPRRIPEKYIGGELQRLLPPFSS
jgi:hypothetical protein